MITSEWHTREDGALIRTTVVDGRDARRLAAVAQAFNIMAASGWSGFDSDNTAETVAGAFYGSSPSLDELAEQTAEDVAEALAAEVADIAADAAEESSPFEHDDIRKAYAAKLGARASRRFYSKCLELLQRADAEEVNAE